jgi:hypothetical protein
MINEVTNKVITVKSNIQTREAMKKILRAYKEMTAASINEKVLKDEASETQKQAYKDFCEVVNACIKMQDKIINKELTSLAFVTGDLEESDKYASQARELQDKFNRMYPQILIMMPKILIGEDVPKEELEDILRDMLNDSEG